MELSLNDFFCGCGGMGIGFKNAGFKINGAWDIDKYAIKTYKHNVDNIAELKNISDLHIKNIPKSTVWSFGFPCQDISIAGNMKGLILKCKDCNNEFNIIDIDNFEGKCPICNGNHINPSTRSGLFFEIMRLLEEATLFDKEKLPKVIFAENVKNLKPYINTLENEFERHGYKAYTSLLNSKYFDVAQNRERYFIVGILNSINKPFFFPEQNKNKVPPLSKFLDKEVDEKYYIDDLKAKEIIDQALKSLESLKDIHATLTPDRIKKRQNGRRAKKNEESMFTLTAQDLHGIIIDDTFGYEDEARIYTDSSPTLRRGRQGLKTIVTEDFDRPIKVIGKLDMKGTDIIKRVYDENGISPTLTTCGGGHRQAKVFDYSKYRVRKLTPKEYGRLQGFPVDDYFEQVVSDSQAYKQFGNAVTTTVITAIANNIIETLKG